MSVVQVQRLSRSFGDVEAVRDISFSFDSGNIFGFIGPNGAGKTTTMRILSGLDVPTSGDCFIDGLSTIDDADQIYRLIGYMPDTYGTYPNMTVLEYLDFFARAYGLRGKARARAVAGVVEFCQLGGLRDKHITTLSKGMKQRLCLGRCLVHDPKVLILDEPTAGLDPRARIEFRDLLRVLRDQGKATFISSHILADLEELCDGIAIIELGALVTTGSVRDIKHAVRHATEARAQEDGELAVIELRLAGEHEDIDRILAEQPGVSDVERHHLTITLRCARSAEQHADLLRRLVAAGLPICHFASREHSLEDLFLHLTEGRVQ